MCGIVGYVGNKQNATWLIDILKKLEYRGYDSAGLSVNVSRGLKVIKTVGEIDALHKTLPQKLLIRNAIAHTRWATHGKPSVLNAHPHKSYRGKWAIVHNGIIENSELLKRKLEMPVSGETDTEILVQYIEENCLQADIENFIKAFKEVSGSYAVACQAKEEKNKLFLAKNKSPLYVAIGENGALVASDPICFCGLADKYYEMPDNSFAVMTAVGVNFYNENGLKIFVPIYEIDDFECDADKGKYPHYMIKEILEQPKALIRQVSAYRDTKCLSGFNSNFIKKYQNVVLIGSGTAYHAAMVGKTFFEEILKMPAFCVVASEFTLNKPEVSIGETLFVIVSQSGETADALSAQKQILKQKGQVIAVTNVSTSTLAKNASFVLPIFAGREIAVASTKAYVCQVSALYLLARHLEEKLLDKAYEEIEEVANSILKFDKKIIDELAIKLQTSKFVMFIGKNQDFITAKESALKLQEITYIPALSVYSGELKHGYLALVDHKTYVFAIATTQDNYMAVKNAVHEVTARGGKVVMVSHIDNSEIKLSKVCKFLMPIISVAPMQYLAYRLSVIKKLNPDKPRNLAKSVTVL